MNMKMLEWLFFGFGAVFLGLLGFTIVNKLYMAARAARIALDANHIKLRIGEFIGISEAEFHEAMETFVKETYKKDRIYRNGVEEYILNELESASPFSERLRYLAMNMDFPSACISQLKSRSARVSALGARRAGLYRYRGAIELMIADLDVLSINNQFEILMGLARIGDAAAMRRAVEKIGATIIVNERAIIEIFNAFPDGEEKKIFFREMIHYPVDYVVALLLKAASVDMAETLVSEIISILQSDKSKELRTSAIRALAALGAAAPAAQLVSALADGDWEIRALAAKALASIKTPEVGAALAAVLTDRQWWVRQNAATALLAHPDCEALFLQVAEAGDTFALDSIVSVLENSPDHAHLLARIRGVAAA